MVLAYEAKVTITAGTQEALFEAFGELVDAATNIANSHRVTLDVAELDPKTIAVDTTTAYSSE